MECDILEALLQTPPKDGIYSPQLAPMEGLVEIILPNCRYKDTPCPMVDIGTSVNKDENVKVVKVVFSARKSLIYCSF